MKANEAPEKIYINSNLEKRTWLIGKGDSSFIEYVRTDAFIEKACEKLEKCMYDNLMFQGRLHRKEIIESFIEDFRNYMKGE